MAAATGRRPATAPPQGGNLAHHLRRGFTIGCLVGGSSAAYRANCARGINPAGAEPDIDIDALVDSFIINQPAGGVASPPPPSDDDDEDDDYESEDDDVFVCEGGQAEHSMLGVGTVLKIGDEDNPDQAGKVKFKFMQKTHFKFKFISH